MNTTVGLSLTTRERDIMTHIATGSTNAQIAWILMISEEAIKSHLKHIANKLNTTSRTEAVAIFGGNATAIAGS